VFVRFPVKKLPERLFEPLQLLVPFVAVHVSAPALVQESVVDPLYETYVCAAVKSTRGGLTGCDPTVTVTVSESVPPAPVQNKLKDVVLVRFETVCCPLVEFFVPFQFAPVLLFAVHEVAFVTDHVSVVEPFHDTEVGFAFNVITGGFTGCDPTLTVTVSEALPPFPVQVIVYVVLLVKLLKDSEPLVDLFPLHPLPVATQEVAFVEFQEIVVEPFQDT
jgi:hypothetical protein